MNTHPPDQPGSRSGTTAIAGCPMSYVCSKVWDDLTPTTDPHIRNCNVCSKPVALCTDRRALLEASKTGGCVALMPTRGPTRRTTLGLPAYGSDRLRRYLDGL